MIPMLIWFIFIVLLALLAFLAIKFLTLRVLLALILSLPILLSVGFVALRRSPVTDSNKMEYFNTVNVVSERGEAHGNVHENTIAAFRQAKTMGADTIKTDVRMTKDGMLIIYRDPSVYDGDNTTYVISDTHWIQLSKINVYGGNNGTIMTFDDAVNWCTTNNMNMIWHIPTFSGDLLTYMRNKILQDNLYSKVALTTYSVLAALNMRCSDTKLLMGLLWKSTEYSIVNGTAVGDIYTSWYYSMMDSFTYWGVRSFLLPTFLGIDFLGTSVEDADRALINEGKTYGINTLLTDLATTQERNYFARQLSLPILVDDLSVFTNALTQAFTRTTVLNR